MPPSPSHSLSMKYGEQYSRITALEAASLETVHSENKLLGLLDYTTNINIHQANASCPHVGSVRWLHI